jgi:hypothetical protein
LYNLEEGHQYFIPTIERGLQITNVALSLSKRWLAISQKGVHRAMLSVYDITNRKKKRELPLNDAEETEYSAKEFLSVAFSPKNDK